MKSGLYILIVALAVSFSSHTMAQVPPLTINSYYGVYDAHHKISGFPASSLKGPVKEVWTTPVPKKRYRIGVLLPTPKDDYWVSANYGIVSHAKRLGVEIILHFVENYLEFGDQKRLLLDLVKKTDVDGIVLASVDYLKMGRSVEEVRLAGVPVIGLINDIHAPDITAKAMVSYHDAGRKAGEYVMADAAGRNIKVALFPGPKPSGWAEDMVRGFMSAVNAMIAEGQSVTVPPPSYGDTRPVVQRLRLSAFFSKTKNHDTDYVVGNAVAAAEAAAYLKTHRDTLPYTKIVSTYLTGNLYELVKTGEVKAAPYDQVLVICQVALDMMTRLLNGEAAGIDVPFRAGPDFLLITQENISQYSYEQLFGPRTFQPVFNAIP